MIEIPTAKTLDDLFAEKSDETKPTMAASRIAGPKLLAGSVVYIITPKKMKASATDLLVSLEPSVLVTGTMKRLEATVSAARNATMTMPLQPSSGSRTGPRIPATRIAAPATETAASNNRLFQLRRSIFLPRRRWKLTGEG